MGRPAAPLSHPTVDYDQQRIQDAVAQAFRRLAVDVPFLDGNRVAVTLSAGTPTDVGHGLARKPRGIFAIDNNSTNILATLVVWDPALSNRLTINLTSYFGGDCVLWVW